MKKLRLLSSIPAIGAILMLALMYVGCEDMPSMSDLDRYFEEHPYISDPRTDPAAGNLEISPESATVSVIGEQIAFKVTGGGSPYTWDVANTLCGTITADNDRSDSAIYTVVAVAANTIIVYDKDGRAGIAAITTASGAQDFEIIPDSITLSGTNLVGQTVQFLVAGGVPPYGTWKVSLSSVGTIDANGLYTAGSGLGQNLVSITDNAGAVASATVIQELAAATTLSIAQGGSIDCLQSEVINFAAVGGVLPYNWLSSKVALGTIDASTGVYTGNGTTTYGTNIVVVTDAANSVDTITVIHK